MRIADTIEKSGYFWLPNTEHDRVSGSIRVSDGGEIELEIVGLLQGNDKLTYNGGMEIGRIIGTIEKYGPVTLDGCV